MKVFLLRAFCLCLLFPLVACRGVTEEQDPGESFDAADHPTAMSVATLETLAALVNGEAISVYEFDRSVLRYEAALEVLGLDISEQGDYPAVVLDQAIDARLIAQEARVRGLDVEDHELQRALNEGIRARGGRVGFDDWLRANYFSEDEFLQGLEDQLLAGKVQEAVLTSVGSVAEHVRVRHVLLGTREQAEVVESQLANGADFATLAFEYSLDISTRVNGGDLGWFPRGFLTTPELEAVAFELMPGERSGIVETALGFHLVESLGRDEQRQLSPQAGIVFRQAVVDRWLMELRLGAEIERFVP